MTNKKTLAYKQIIISLWLIVAAITIIEMLKQFDNGGFKNIWVYILSAISALSIYMYFKLRKNRFNPN